MSYAVKFCPHKGKLTAHIPLIGKHCLSHGGHACAAYSSSPKLGAMVMSYKILIVEDESAIRDMLSFALRRAVLEPICAEDVRAAEMCLAKALPDLILLDWMLPGGSGLEFARRLRRDVLTKQIPIIMITARGEEDDRVLGLEAGVDDYIVKPFSTREVIARIKAVLRRSSVHDENEQLQLGELLVDLAGQRIFARQQLLPLGPSEYRLLQFFASHPERVYSRAQLLDFVWGRSADVEERTVDVHIRRLRRALEPFQMEDYLQTVRGSGYRLSVMK
jgi:two-component system, OmpR family, phosphate regulon response regulator PhoB